jgi:hypothetical protein
MKRLFALVLAAGFSAGGQAADAGIGVSVQSDDSMIYVPIDFNQNFRIEPSFRYYHTKVTQPLVKVKQESRELGLGIFGLLPIHESVRIYYGGRLAYVDAEISYDYDASVFFPPDFTQESDGYRISPTLGFEYLINKYVSVGAEAEWFYLDVDGKSNDPGDTGQEQQSHGTDSRLVVRFRF